MKKIAKKTPKVGDPIEHTCTLNGTFEGKVVQLLSMQFVYETADGIGASACLGNNGNLKNDR